MGRKVLVYLAVVAGIVAFAGLFVLIFGNSIEVRCVREPGREPGCRITKKLLGQLQVSSHDILGVTDVQLDETCDDGCSYRAVLLTSSGESVPVNDVYTDRAIVIRQMDALKSFLGGTALSFQYTEPAPWWVVIMLAGMALVGLVVVAGSFLRAAQSGR
jgi:hypothetical protein